jgi:hypothetical protein
VRTTCDPHAPGRTRTCDPRLRRPVLCPAELRALVTSSPAVVGLSKLATGIEPVTSSLPRMRSTPELREPVPDSGTRLQGRRDSNPQPPVLETGALPVELRPLAPAWLGTDLNRRHPRFQRGALPTELPSPVARLSARTRRRLLSSGGGIRTHDLVVNSHPLWPLSYPGMRCRSLTRRPVFRRRHRALARRPDDPQAPNTLSNNPDPQENRPAWRGQVEGRIQLNSGGRIRTCDLRVMSPTSYQTAPPRIGPTMVALDPPCVNPNQPALAGFPGLA